jgi:hypothetical protein
MWKSTTLSLCQVLLSLEFCYVSWGIKTCNSLCEETRCIWCLQTVQGKFLCKSLLYDCVKPDSTIDQSHAAYKHIITERKGCLSEMWPFSVTPTITIFQISLICLSVSFHIFQKAPLIYQYTKLLSPQIPIKMSYGTQRANKMAKMYAVSENCQLKRNIVPV